MIGRLMLFLHEGHLIRHWPWVWRFSTVWAHQPAACPRHRRDRFLEQQDHHHASRCRDKPLLLSCKPFIWIPVRPALRWPEWSTFPLICPDPSHWASALAQRLLAWIIPMPSPVIELAGLHGGMGSATRSGQEMSPSVHFLHAGTPGIPWVLAP